MHSVKKGECLLAYREGKVAWLDTNGTGELLHTKKTGELLHTKKTERIGEIVGYKEDGGNCCIQRRQDKGNCWIQRRRGELLDTKKTGEF